jgi:LytR cell envelope-related transcriptional attenuator
MPGAPSPATAPTGLRPGGPGAEPAVARPGSERGTAAVPKPGGAPSGGGPSGGPPSGGAPPGGPALPGKPSTAAGGRAPSPATAPSGAPPRLPGRTGVPARPGAQQTAIIPPRRPPWYRSLLANPRYLVLAVAGVLILGGGAAFGVVQLTNDDGGGTARQPEGGGGGGTSGGGDQDQQRLQRSAVNPADVTVAVLNGTTVPGLAAQLADRVETFGFQIGTIANSSNQQRAESVVMFASGHEREAAAVGRRLGIAQREPVDPESQGLAGDATVVVIAGADKTQ